MIYIIVFLIIFTIFLIGFFEFFKPRKKFSDYLWTFIPPFFLAFFASYVIGGCIVIIFNHFYQPSEPYKKVIAQSPIIALKDSSLDHSSYFLSSGNIENEPYYIFMKEMNGGYVMSKHQAKDTIIYFDDNPRVEIYKMVSNDNNYQFWTWQSPLNSRQDERYAIYVPEGTIKQNFNVDLE